MNGTYAGIDIGGSSVKWIVVTANGKIIDTGSTTTDRDNIITQASNISIDLRTQHPTLEAIGVITPGLVDETTGTVHYAANLALENAPLKERIAHASQLPTALGHDGRSAGLAEGLLGAGRGASSYVMIPIGTGISAAIYTGQHLITGAQYSAGEIGHAPAILGGDPCNCGQSGCLEVYASAKGIAHQYARLTGNNIGTREIEQRLGTDPAADHVWNQAIRTMATALAHLTFTLDPARIIIGGGLSHAGEAYMTPLRHHLAELMTWREPPDIVTATLGDMAGRWGATILACQQLGRHDYEHWEIQ